MKIKVPDYPTYLQRIEERPGHFLIVLEGPIGTAALEKGRRQMTEVIHHFQIYSRPVICDMSLVTTSDTATIAALVMRLADRDRARGKKIIFFGLNDPLTALFEISKLKDRFLICATYEEALTHL